MRKVNQQGRSMVEMLGVLAIIGVLTVGGLSVVGKARQQQELTQLLSEVAEIVNAAKKMACDYDDGYSSYTDMLCSSEANPKGTECGTDGVITTSSDVTVEIVAETGSGEGGLKYFVANIGDMSEEACVYLATSDWGRRNTNGFVGAYFTGSPSTDAPMDPGVAATSCVESDGVVASTLHLKFLACQKN